MLRSGSTTWYFFFLRFRSLSHHPKRHVYEYYQREDSISLPTSGTWKYNRLKGRNKEIRLSGKRKSGCWSFYRFRCIEYNRPILATLCNPWHKYSDLKTKKYEIRTSLSDKLFRMNFDRIKYRYHSYNRRSSVRSNWNACTFVSHTRYGRRNVDPILKANDLLNVELQKIFLTVTADGF